MTVQSQIKWAVALHGGADATPDQNYAHVEVHLRTLLGQVCAQLAQGEHALDVAQFAVAELEACGHHIAGRGASPNKDGVWELDAAIMHGPDRQAGAVSALSGFESPIGVARDVLARSEVMLTGTGAAKFARAGGHAEIETPERYYTPSSRAVASADAPGHGTVGAVVRDQSGGLVAATSTGGLLNKTAGRVGDSPLIGAGTWADEHVAVSCTGEGEYFIRAGVARQVSARMAFGAEPLARAAEASLADMARLGGKGGLSAVDAAGRIAMPYNSAGLKRAWADSTGRAHVKIFE